MSSGGGAGGSGAGGGRTRPQWGVSVACGEQHPPPSPPRGRSLGLKGSVSGRPRTLPGSGGLSWPGRLPRCGCRAALIRLPGWAAVPGLASADPDAADREARAGEGGGGAARRERARSEHAVPAAGVSRAGLRGAAGTVLIRDSCPAGDPRYLVSAPALFGLTGLVTVPYLCSGPCDPVS